MIQIDREKPGNLLKYFREKRAELNAQQANLTMPVPLYIDDVIWLLEKIMEKENVTPKD